MHGEFSSHVSVGLQALVIQLWVLLNPNYQLLIVKVSQNEAFKGLRNIRF